MLHIQAARLSLSQLESDYREVQAGLAQAQKALASLANVEDAAAQVAALSTIYTLAPACACVCLCLPRMFLELTDVACHLFSLIG